MIILIFGKSGSGKTYLSGYLHDNLDNSIHIDIDELNSDLYSTPNVQEYARSLFGDNVITGNKLNKEVRYTALQNEDIYNTWVQYMTECCQHFLDGYIASTHYAYYIIDHINSHLFDFSSHNVVKILCEENDDTRYARLVKREKISEETLNFRDKHFVECDGDIIYKNNNQEDVLNKIKQN